MNNDLTSFEKIPVKIFTTSGEGSVFVAQEIDSVIKIRQLEGKPCVLGLATGSTQTRVYDELIKLHKTE
jgi:glucosamine-6-phosphate deaminase